MQGRLPLHTHWKHPNKFFLPRFGHSVSPDSVTLPPTTDQADPHGDGWKVTRVAAGPTMRRSDDTYNEQEILGFVFSVAEAVLRISVQRSRPSK